jgi:hypothetical protein
MCGLLRRIQPRAISVRMKIAALPCVTLGSALNFVMESVGGDVTTGGNASIGKGSTPAGSVGGLDVALGNSSGVGQTRSRVRAPSSLAPTPKSAVPASPAADSTSLGGVSVGCAPRNCTLNATISVRYCLDPPLLGPHARVRKRPFDVHLATLVQILCAGFRQLSED